MTISNLETLAFAWKISRDAEDEAKQKRLDIEEQILNAVNGETKFFNLRIGYKDNRIWDHAVLYPMRYDEHFPFKTEFKEIRADSKALEKMAPNYWAEKYAKALTIKPAKPSFTWKG